MISSKDIVHKTKEKPRIVTNKAPIVPDFDKSYNNFLKSLQLKKCSRLTTVIQPFSFDDEIDVRKLKNSFFKDFIRRKIAKQFSDGAGVSL
jgi:hypothetical protein